MDKPKGLLERLKNDESIVCAEGYLFAFESRGYLKAGAYVPEVVVEHPELVRFLHEEFVHSGSDIVEAFTYYGHRQKLKLVGREDELEKFNRQALKIARQVADKTGTLMAGNICNTTLYRPDDNDADEICRQIFIEQIQWAVEEGADFIIGETFGEFGEAEIALKAIKEVAPNMPAVITLAPVSHGVSYDGLSFPEALRKLELLGADVVGLNCHRGPETTIPLMREIRKVCKGPLACLPVAYRTSEEDGICMQNLRDKYTGQHAFPANLDAWLVSRSCIEKMTRDLLEIGVQYMGVCCGNRAHYIRTMAETLGRKPAASRFSPDMAMHLSQVKEANSSYANKNWHITYALKD